MNKSFVYLFICWWEFESFFLLAIVNNAAKNIGIQYLFLFSGYKPWHEIVGSYGNLTLNCFRDRRTILYTSYTISHSQWQCPAIPITSQSPSVLVIFWVITVFCLGFWIDKTNMIAVWVEFLCPVEIFLYFLHFRTVTSNFRYLLGGKNAFILRACNTSPTWTFFFFKTSSFIVLGEGKITDEGNNDELHKIK